MQINGQDNGYVVFTPKQCLFENKSFAYLNDRSTKIRKGKMAIDPACRGNLLETTEISTPELELKTKGTGIRLKAPKKD